MSNILHDPECNCRFQWPHTRTVVHSIRYAAVRIWHLASILWHFSHSRDDKSARASLRFACSLCGQTDERACKTRRGSYFTIHPLSYSLELEIRVTVSSFHILTGQSDERAWEMKRRRLVFRALVFTRERAQTCFKIMQFHAYDLNLIRHCAAQRFRLLLGFHTQTTAGPLAYENLGIWCISSIVSVYLVANKICELLNREKFSNVPHDIHNITAVVLIPSLCLLFCLILCIGRCIYNQHSLTRFSQLSQKSASLTAPVFTQASIVSFLYVTGAIIFIIMDIFTMPQEIITFGMIGFQSLHVIFLFLSSTKNDVVSHSLIYLMLNRSVRHYALSLFGTKGS
ncbi:hypothetical protein PRIPAC_81564, partial [Pristionchus pacificus]|uniref:G protein-coupled receptor n=1 Tax=Pristionchus pacificus TaxID=54126 RepID=A0A2A6CNP7_PRIPA